MHFKVYFRITGSRAKNKCVVKMWISKKNPKIPHHLKWWRMQQWPENIFKLEFRTCKIYHH